MVARVEGGRLGPQEIWGLAKLLAEGKPILEVGRAVRPDLLAACRSAAELEEPFLVEPKESFEHCGAVARGDWLLGAIPEDVAFGCWRGASGMVGRRGRGQPGQGAREPPNGC